MAGIAARGQWWAAERKEGEHTRHPFVIEAGRLAVLALDTKQPERFIWIDESGVVTKIGSRGDRSAPLRSRKLWIPPSTGWAALDPSAQQLVADVQLLLNLAERGEKPRDVRMRLERANRPDLPPCMTTDRKWLEPGRTVGAAKTSGPGTNCKSGCPFQLCPYPPKGAQSHREEFGEAFCRRQETLLGRTQVRRSTAPWQGVLPKDLRRFWAEMAQRARR
jgi:hypothetical protein